MFSKSTFSKNSFRMSSRLDSDQAPGSVGPDLGPDCLQRLFAKIKIIRGQGQKYIIL